MMERKMSSTAESSSPRLFYGYVIVAAAFGIQWVAFGTFNTNGIFLNPILAEFGWTRAAISVAYTIGFLMMGIMSVVAGNLNDRFGPRKVMGIAGLLLALGPLLLSRIDTSWQMYLCYVLYGTGLGAVDATLLSTIARWFVKRRGVIMAFTKVAAGIGIFSIPLLTSWLIGVQGWRITYVAIGALLGLVVVPASFFLYRDPSEKGLTAYGASLDFAGKPGGPDGLSFSEAIRTRQFWTVCAIYFADSLCMQTASTHITPHAISLGIGSTSAASLISVIGIASIIGRLTIGFSSDKIGPRRAMVIVLVVLLVGFAWLQVADVLWMLYLFVILDGLNHGGIVTVITPVVAELFGTRALGTILGVVLFSGIALGGLGAWLAGYIYDLTGSYSIAFGGLLVIAVTGLLLGLSLKPITKGGKK
ncbi:MAG: MFS transporter [Dehalococcoidales bacterium]|nr:MFS transporter [Dehalococcoidales bacterium]